MFFCHLGMEVSFTWKDTIIGSLTIITLKLTAVLVAMVIMCQFLLDLTKRSKKIYEFQATKVSIYYEKIELKQKWSG